MNPIRRSSGWNVRFVNSTKFELPGRSFISCLKSRVSFPLSRFLKTASAWSKTSFFDGLKS